MLSENERQRLASVRHDLRTPINHILGYTEILLEEPTAADYAEDLRRIRKSGRQLLDLVTYYLGDEILSDPERDHGKLLHDLRTPVNHVIGYSELLEERAEEEHKLNLLPDLQRIHRAAKTWLQLMENQWVPLTEIRPRESITARGMEAHLASVEANQVSSVSSNRTVSGLTGRVLVVDDDTGNRELLCRRLRRDGHEVIQAESGNQALEILQKSTMDLVLLDIQMPDLDGTRCWPKPSRRRRCVMCPLL